MKITLINAGLDSASDDFEAYLKDFRDKFEESGGSCIVHVLRELDIHYCTGCWSCWWKTPGKCIFRDDMEMLYSGFIGSDILVFASPLIAGFTTSLLKKLNDRMIPMIHPYIRLIKGECHHRKRYEQYPDIGLIIKPEMDTDEDDISINKSVYKRFALNFHGNLRFVKTINDKPEEVFHAAYSI